MVRRRLGIGLEKIVRIRAKVHQDFAEFTHLEVSGSLVLLAATVLALLIANSPLHGQFEALWETEIAFEIGSFHFGETLRHWVNDALMALFFFVVGLEIKREFIVGELSSARQAALPMIAALGGMVAPAIAYTLVASGSPGGHAWGVPMATDIAFALGVLALLGSRVPISLKIFLTALAIADDIGAVLVIAVFYSGGIHGGWLLLAFGLLGLLTLLSVARVESPVPYFVVGSVVWFAFLHSGVHATIAGVLVALTIPARARTEPAEFVDWARGKLDEILNIDVPGAHVLESDDQQLCAMEIQSEARFIQAPLQRLMHGLHPLTTFMVLPLFALANAGVALVGVSETPRLGAVGMGIALGLLVGKQLGVVGASFVAVKLGVGRLPEGLTWRHIWGAGLLAGIGFTMALFVSGLALTDAALLAEAKLAILVSSVVAGLAGYIVLRGAAAAAEESI